MEALKQGHMPEFVIPGMLNENNKHATLIQESTWSLAHGRLVQSHALVEHGNELSFIHATCPLKRKLNHAVGLEITTLGVNGKLVPLLVLESR